MTVELMRNDATRYAIFYIDNANEIDKLPTSKVCGKEELIKSATVSAGSLARVQDGSQYILNGSDMWVRYNGNSSSSGTGSSTIEMAAMSSGDINALFGAV